MDPFDASETRVADATATGYEGKGNDVSTDQLEAELAATRDALDTTWDESRDDLLRREETLEAQIRGERTTTPTAVKVARSLDELRERAEQLRAQPATAEAAI